jgi:hypothetical protein
MTKTVAVFTDLSASIYNDVLLMRGKLGIFTALLDLVSTDTPADGDLIIAMRKGKTLPTIADAMELYVAAMRETEPVVLALVERLRAQHRAALARAQ